MARLAEEETKKAKTDLESRVDCLEAKVKMAEYLLAKERTELKQKIENAEDKAIDMVWYHLWSTNPEVMDLSFLE